MTLIEATRAIQSNLEKLDAIAVKLPLAGLLKRAADQGEDVSPEIRRLFKDYPRAWQAIQEWLGSDVQGTKKKDCSLPGEPSQTPGMKEYRCPIEGCTQGWFQQRVGQQIPICETHGIQLQPVQETATHE